MEKIKEKWKKTKYPGYLVSNLGKVKSLARKTNYFKTKILKPQKHTGGYHTITLWVDGQANIKFVHVLVLETFKKKKNKTHQVRHLDGNKKNNKLCNLKWGTPSENQKDRIKHGTSQIGISRKNNIRLNKKDILNIRSLFSVLKNRTEVSRKIGISRTTVADVVNGRTHKKE